jgi:hypothetical protein
LGIRDQSNSLLTSSKLHNSKIASNPYRKGFFEFFSIPEASSKLYLSFTEFVASAQGMSRKMAVPIPRADEPVA